MRQDQRAEGVQLAEVPHEEEQRDRQRLHRHHLRHQEHDQQGGAELEAEAGHGGGGQEGDQRGEDDDRARHQQAVEEVAAEVLLLEDPAERVERGCERPGAGLGGLDLPAGLKAESTIQYSGKATATAMRRAAVSASSLPGRLTRRNVRAPPPPPGRVRTALSVVALTVPPLAPHQAQIDQRDGQQDHQHHDADRRSEAVLRGRERLLVRVHVEHQVLAGDAAAARHDVDLGEDLEVPDDRLDGDDDQDGLEHRRHDGAPDPPLGRAVQRGGLQHLGGDGPDARVDGDHHEQGTSTRGLRGGRGRRRCSGRTSRRSRRVRAPC